MGCQLSGILLGSNCRVNGKDIALHSQHDVIQIVGKSKDPITLQLETRQSCYHEAHMSDCSTQTDHPWNTPRSFGVSMRPQNGCSPHCNRICESQFMSQGRYHTTEYLPSFPRDVEQLRAKDPTASHFTPKECRFLNICCSFNTDGSDSFLSQTHAENNVLQRISEFTPAHHELDSGLGCTDGSFHQGELSELETEGAEEAGSSPPDRASRTSRSSESLISSELSDLGFYSVGTGEFRSFQKVLERRIRQYRAKTLPGRRAKDFNDKKMERVANDNERKHLQILEAIPETLVCQQPLRSKHPNNTASTSAGSEAYNSFLGAPSGQYKKVASPRRRSYDSVTYHTLQTVHSSTCTPKMAVQKDSSCSEWLMNNTWQTSRQFDDQKQIWHGQHVRSAKVPLQRTFLTNYPEKQSSENNNYRKGNPRERKTENLCGNPAQRDPLVESDPNHGSTQTRNKATGCGIQTQTRHPNSYGQCDDTSIKIADLSNQDNLHHDTLSSQEGQSQLIHSTRTQRSQFLKARALRIADERNGMTTDDDTRSEIKTGRYWSKAERKRHLASAREHRQKRVSRMERRRSSGNDSTLSSTILEMSQRKLSKIRNKKVLDNWITIQELLTHGSKTGAGGTRDIPLFSPLLSVTTV
ncbi:PDZ domain-containing RING finger protein 4-like [Erpetoichthys calabaricus]|uniref:PDZ domain-containing RING finger protein 4-like n=1 Tax=Erpetoichthys calabaricus TaxID=27687 RepID=UPI0022349836|nr:PDZ domain-containing RING finger protein 4-like [Erpetoichthys calabaricus]